MVWHLLSAPHQWQEKLLLLQVKQSLNEAQESAWTLRGWRQRMKRRRDSRLRKGREGPPLLFLGLVLVLVGVVVVAAMLDSQQRG